MKTFADLVIEAEFTVQEVAYLGDNLRRLIELVRADERDRAMRENAYVLAQPERLWVGLTDAEITDIVGPWGSTPITGYTRELFDKIEAKLKDKNT